MNTGDRRERGATDCWFVFHGSLPGTTSIAVQRPDGIDLVAPVNARSTKGDDNNKLQEALTSAVDSIFKK